MTWINASIADVCLPTTQTDPARLDRKFFRYIDISGVDKETKSISKSDELRIDEAPSRARKIIETSDVLVSTVRPNLNAVALVPINLNGEIASTGFSILRANKELINPKYLFYWTQSKEFVEFLVSNATGASYPAVTELVVKRAPIPLATLNEQNQIIKLLDEAQRLRMLSRRADTKAAAILPALFENMFGDPASNPMNWKTYKLKQLADTASGGTPSTKEDSYFGGDIPWIKSGELSNREIFSSEESITSVGLQNSSAKWVEPGSILLAMYGATVGQVSILNIRSTTNQAVCSIKTKDELQTRYLAELLRLLKTTLLSKRVGGAQPNISQQIIRDLQIIMPPEKLQMRFTKCAEITENILTQTSICRKNIEKLYEQILHQAFRGRLTSIWREKNISEIMTEMKNQSKILNNDNK